MLKEATELCSDTLTTQASNTISSTAEIVDPSLTTQDLADICSNNFSSLYNSTIEDNNVKDNYTFSKDANHDSKMVTNTSPNKLKLITEEDNMFISQLLNEDEMEEFQKSLFKSQIKTNSQLDSSCVTQVTSSVSSSSSWMSDFGFSSPSI